MDWGGFVHGGGIDFVHGYEGFIGTEGSRGRLSGSHCAGIAEVVPLEVLLEGICFSVVQSIVGLAHRSLAPELRNDCSRNTEDLGIGH